MARPKLSNILLPVLISIGCGNKNDREEFFPKIPEISAKDCEQQASDNLGDCSDGDSNDCFAEGEIYFDHFETPGTDIPVFSEMEMFKKKIRYVGDVSSIPLENLDDLLVIGKFCNVPIMECFSVANPTFLYADSFIEVVDGSAHLTSEFPYEDPFQSMWIYGSDGCEKAYELYPDEDSDGVYSFGGNIEGVETE
jgi:hypothetical protein